MLTFWVIYDHPADYPGHFVLRPQLPIAQNIISFGEAQLFDSLEDARKAVPPGLACAPRGDTDIPCIVEAWY